MTIRSQIQDAINDPEKLEALYRQNSKRFSKAYKDVLDTNPDSILLRAWEARLNYSESTSPRLTTIDLIVMLLLCIAAGTLLKIPEWTTIKDAEFFPRFVALIPMGAMFLYTMHLRQWPRVVTSAGIGVIASLIVVMSITPSDWDDVFQLASLNLPFLLWTLYGAARMNKEWRSTNARIEFIRFSGELIIHSGLFFIGGAVLLLLTSGLFELLNIRTQWVFEYPAIYGLASIPLVAAWATDTYSAARKLVPLLARIFSPLLLALIVAYMGAMALRIEELFQDRSTLLIYNILLLCVLTTAVFTLTGQKEKKGNKLENGIISYMIGATLILDIMAIAAIGWRIFEFGITPNRMAVLGSNIVVFGNLLTMGLGYVHYWRKINTLESIEQRLAQYLPVYTCWTLFSVLIQPWLFRN
ncbi:hypothetical protein [Pseudodesulfovibrio sp. zrk46]|uniref:hypothetical protein n=1 Tax=Pseudodesulfovibrio sp. zrk46 TaxID=2725288 RepID=UPI001449A67D|nr:hypothetical protein [Pseudodesulfovibrio sp. zrk46]QJB57277.1 hypothetical protein HFN16_13050 [Pseudodesulfovibrio sp. zrk46]